MSQPTREQHNEWAAQMDCTADRLEVDGNHEDARKARWMATHHRHAGADALSEAEKSICHACGQTATEYSRAKRNGSIEGVGVSSLLKR